MKFLELYRQGHWEVAAKYASDLKKCWKGEMTQYYDMMIERIEEFKVNPPAKWDGIYRATSK
jgi:hypothetical protein